MYEDIPTLNILDLFSGSARWVEPWKKSVSYNIIIDSLDILKLPHINLQIDIRDFKPTKEYHIVYASPECKNFSKLKNCCGGATKEEMQESIELAQLSFDFAKKAKICYVIENPYTGLMKEYFPSEHYQIVDYSEYGFPMRKRTALWTNFKLNLKLQKEVKYNRLPLHYLSKMEKAKIPLELSTHIKNTMVKLFTKELQEFKIPFNGKPGFKMGEFLSSR